MEINTHGLKMFNLDAAAAETKWLASPNTLRYGAHVQISYDCVTGDVHADYLIGDSWMRYRDQNIIDLFTAKEPMSAQEIADTIEIYMSVYHWNKIALAKID